MELCVRSQSRTLLKGVVLLRFGTGHLAVAVAMAVAVAGAPCLHKSAKASGISPTRKFSDNGIEADINNFQSPYGELSADSR